MKKKFLVIVGMLAFINGYAANNDNDYQNCEDYQSAFQGHSAPEDQMKKGYNHPARIDVKGSWDFYVSGSYIYWHPKENGLEIAREVNIPILDLPTETLTNHTFVHMDFDYHSGFKVGTGGNFERDNWCLDFEYTRLYITDHRSKTLTRTSESLATHYFVPFWNVEKPSKVYYARGRWKLHFNVLDGVLGRSYYVGTKLSFKPYVGLRAGWINQKYRVNYTYTEEFPTDVYTDSYLRTHCKSQSWLLGPRIGLDTNWHLGEGFRLFGNTAASLFYQRFKTDVEMVNKDLYNLIDELRKIKEKEGYFNPNFEIALGLGWGSYFCNDNWHIDLLAAYEFHIFWDQNMMRKIGDYSSLDDINSDPTPGDLILHGLTVSLTFDF
jgi:hypothetical protein